MVRLIEEQSLNVWPALQTLCYDGWVLRFAAGYTRRANSINPLYPSTLDLTQKVVRCEQIYGSQGQATVFKLTAAAQPGDLDGFLEHRGYHREATTSVQTVELSYVGEPLAGTFEQEPAPSDGWLDDFCELNGVDRRRLPAMRGVLGNLLSPACFGSLRMDGAVGALGLAVLQQECVWLFDVVTSPACRRRGLGRSLVLHLLEWARAHGATRAYLQVMLNNEPALRLYGGLGFAEVYQYWYRAKRP